MQISGARKCHHCGNRIEWETTPIVPIGQIVAYTVPENVAEAVAIEKNPDGTTKFEIICQCKKCGVRNKFTADK